MSDRMESGDRSLEVRKNYFELLGLPQAFEVDEKALHNLYMKLQRIVHPDILARKSQAEQMQGLQLSADINQAYQTIKAPLKRAEYLLSLNNIYVASEKNAVKAEMSLLMESMELREALAECDDHDKLTDMLQNAEAIQTNSNKQFSNDFSNNALSQAAQTAIRWRFANKYIEEIKLKIKSNITLNQLS